MTAYKCYIPSKFNFEDINSNSSLASYSKHKIVTKNTKDQIHLILHLISELPCINRSYQRKGFTVINHQFAQRALSIRYISNYLHWLVDCNVLVRSPNYVVGLSSYGFKFSDEYIDCEFKYVEFERSQVWLRFKKVLSHRSVYSEFGDRDSEQTISNPQNPSISQPVGKDNFDLNNSKLDAFFEKIQINERQSISVFRNLNKLCHKGNQFENLRKLRIYQHMLNRVSDKTTLNIKFDSNTGRYYTPLTNLKKEFRNFINYDGKTLISIDIKNSQPLILTLILTPSFWSKTNSKSTSLYDLPKTYISALEGLKIGSLITKQNNLSLYRSATGNIEFNSGKDNKKHLDTKESLYQKNKVLDHIIFKSSKELKEFKKNETVQKLENQLKYQTDKIKRYLKSKNYIANRSKYTTDTIGGLYNSLLDDLQNIYPNIFWDRDKVKRGIMFSFYSSNYAHTFQNDFHNKNKESKVTQDDYLIKSLFQEKFPGVNQIFSLIKRNDKSLLARLAQSIESVIMYERIIPRIQKEHPSIPITTIHDSIVAPVINKKIILSIIEEELTIALNLEVKIDLEREKPWKPENFDFDSFL